MAADDKRTILIVDSNAEVVSTLTERLEKRGMNVISAQDGFEGLKAARSDNPDLILLEVLLPNLDGYRICRLLKFDQRYRHIPIIFISSKYGDREKRIGKEVGADRFLGKPFKMGELLPMIDELIGD